jgi:hypothetical protein
MKTIELTDMEKKEIVGGLCMVAASDSHADNLNNSFGCGCTYPNRGNSLKNSNTAASCHCDCI